ncbi:Spore germination lipase LipC [Rubrobacter xylanophilus DSM 9941]|uniref:SGNH/GDSL hydrolase family protein n=1 Tax=Rubrobacter xylanophilus TaxID=49319 RepID=UPI001C63E8FD|nr:SGNH/GDSL hydrolase family protein [Rubrobacter xylanophilus]QYJ15140.1 Spore germination lipase LipC [Rubrobacter xylanophilus DSM 9941]
MRPRAHTFPLVLLFAAVLLAGSCHVGRPPLAYLSLGDSLAVGVGSSDPPERGYAPLYEARLERETGREVDLVQLGVSGETSESFIGSYPDPDGSQLARAESVLRRSPGALVTLSLGGNDLLQPPPRRRREAIERFGENLDRILHTLRRASDPPPRIVVLLLYSPNPESPADGWISRMNAEILDRATRHGVAVANPQELFRGHEREYLRPGDIHPTDAGHRAIARALAQAHRIPTGTDAG